MAPFLLRSLLSMQRTRLRPASECLTVVFAFTLILLGQLENPWLPREIWLILCFSCAAGVLVATSTRSPGLDSVVALGLATIGGYASFPAWYVTIAVLGLALGLDAGRAPTVWNPSVAHLLLVVVLAPCAEELLFRDRLLPLLGTRLAAPLAIGITSALFSVLHVDPWRMLTTFLLGGVLGVLAFRSGRIAPCIGIHAGLNLASLTFGIHAGLNLASLTRTPTGLW